MKNIKNFKEFQAEVASDPELQEKLKANPVATVNEYSLSTPAYTADKLVYRVVVAGFVLVLVTGIIYFIYQYQKSIQIRVAYSEEILKMMRGLSGTDNLAAEKLANLKGSIVSPTGINGTTPDGIIAVFTAIIGALAGLFAPSPVARNGSEQ